MIFVYLCFLYPAMKEVAIISSVSSNLSVFASFLLSPSYRIGPISFIFNSYGPWLMSELSLLNISRTGGFWSDFMYTFILTRSRFRLKVGFVTFQELWPVNNVEILTWLNTWELNFDIYIDIDLIEVGIEKGSKVSQSYRFCPIGPFEWEVRVSIFFMFHRWTSIQCILHVLLRVHKRIFYLFCIAMLN